MTSEEQQNAINAFKHIKKSERNAIHELVPGKESVPFVADPEGNYHDIAWLNCKLAHQCKAGTRMASPQ